MKMTADGKENSLVTLMANVFLSCESPLARQASNISVVVCKDFIPFVGTIQDLNVFPPLTALRNAEKRFVQYGDDILQKMIEKGEMKQEASKTNVRTLIVQLVFADYHSFSNHFTQRPRRAPRLHADTLLPR